jgi:hypothetical protein
MLVAYLAAAGGVALLVYVGMLAMTRTPELAALVAAGRRRAVWLRSAP